MVGGTSSTFLTSDRERELAEYADWIADEYAPQQGVVSPDDIARKKSIGLSHNDYGNAFDGLLEHRNGRFHIYCNTGQAPTPERVRFTIAHELGHYFIDEHREALRSGTVKEHGSFCDFRSKNPVEREADCFASNLLMPPTRVLRDLQGRDPGMATALWLANRYQTSRTSAVVKMVSLDQVACAAVLWQDGAFSWKRLSGQARSLGMRSRLTDASTIPSDSATGRVVGGEAPLQGGALETATTASAWFSGITPGSRQDFILREEAVSLGRFGVLTFLSLLE